MAWVCLAAGAGARAETVTNLNHTIVRLAVSTGGTNAGSIDLELFDQEKPETVKNFLLYVYSGGYSNLVLHRFVRDFVLQGGHVNLTNAASTNQFNGYLDGPDFGPITNEYRVGPQLSNTYGTIVMARVQGETNSASTDWFINLADNLYLDAEDGGFTVFGRVVNTTNAQTGTNLLGQLNQARTRFVTTSSPSDYFFNLPVSAFRYAYVTNRIVMTNTMVVTNMMNIVTNSIVVTNTTVTTNTLAAQNRDLYVVKAFVLQGGSPRDTNAPRVTIGNPSADTRTTNASFTFSGAATDNMEVARVLYDTADGRFVASGQTNWTAAVTLIPGTNHFTVRSLDRFGNLSPAVKRTVFYSVPQAVTLQLLGTGTGKVIGITNGQRFELGVNYILNAAPAVGNYFLGWSGGFFARDRKIVFRMQVSVTNVVARFSKSFLDLDAGLYQGVFSTDTGGARNSAGFISIMLKPSGAYSGQLQPLGAHYTIRGQLDGTGRSFIYGPLGTNVLGLALGLLAKGSEGFSGYYTDGHFLSPFNLWRVQSYTATNPATAAGTYTFNLSPLRDTNSAVAGGSGFGSVTVDSLGHITVSGLLADGAAIKQSASLLKGDRWPFHASIKKGDAVLGLARFTSNHTFSADVKWFGPGFPGATNRSARLDGSPYTPPSPSARLFDWTNGLVTLSGDGLAEPVTAEVTLSEDGSSLTVSPNTNSLQLTVTNATGWVSGSFTHPVSHALTVLQGAVLQSSNRAAGFFPGSPRNGGFMMHRAP